MASSLLAKFRKGHHTVLLDKLQTNQEREFYLIKQFKTAGAEHPVASSIGVLLCKTPSKTVIEYGLVGLKNPIGFLDYNARSYTITVPKPNMIVSRRP